MSKQHYTDQNTSVTSVPEHSVSASSKVEFFQIDPGFIYAITEETVDSSGTVHVSGPLAFVWQVKSDREVWLTSSDWEGTAASPESRRRPGRGQPTNSNAEDWLPSKLIWTPVASAYSSKKFGEGATDKYACIPHDDNKKTIAWFALKYGPRLEASKGAVAIYEQATTITQL